MANTYLNKIFLFYKMEQLAMLIIKKGQFAMDKSTIK